MFRRNPQKHGLSTDVVRMFGAIALSCFGVTPALSADVSELPLQLREKVEAAAKACATFENGEFDLEWGAVDRVDLDGDLYHDWVLNERGFACSTAASLFCGTGGCMSHFLVGEELHSLLNQGWNVVELGPNKVLLANVHGSQCDSINPTPCVTASTWDKQQKRWQTTGAEWE